MNNEEIVNKLKEWLTFSNGQDYYDYSGNPHWWGDEDDLKRFADDLLKTLQQPRN
jgi:hypothetical protein